MRQTMTIAAVLLLGAAAPASAQMALQGHGPSLVSHGAHAPMRTPQPVFRVDINKTEILRLPAKAGSIVVGNPAIADVSVGSQDLVFVVGRGFGETNLIILDEQGRTVMDADIQVTSVTPSHGLRVFDGGRRRTFSCAPYCQPSPILGDNPDFVGNNTPEVGETSGMEALFEDMFSAAEGAGFAMPSPSGAMGPAAGY